MRGGVAGSQHPDLLQTLRFCHLDAVAVLGGADPFQRGAHQDRALFFPVLFPAYLSRRVDALAGGALGLLLTAVGVSGVGVLFPPEIAKLATLDLSLVALTFAVAIIATVLAAFYPAWRAAHVQPAWQLKSS